MNKVWCETQWSTDIRIETKRIYGRSHYFFNIANSRFKTLTTKRPHWFIEPSEDYELLPSAEPEIYTMDDVRDDFGSSGLVGISLFSGTGGSSLGTRMAGFDVRFASEFVEEARESYLGNFPNSHVDGRDVRELQAQDIMDIVGVDVGELDLFEGSPPCSPFSTIGSREKKWGEESKYSSTSQRTDDLFYEYLRLLNDMQPKTFIAENVMGLTIGKARGYLKQIVRDLSACGYKVKVAILDAADYGVPQDRKRLIMVGVRNDIKKEFVYPPATQTRPVLAHTIIRDYIDMELDETIGLGMPIDAAKRAQGFPDDFFFSHSEAQQYERAGRAVPPPLMRAVAKQVREVLT